MYELTGKCRICQSSEHGQAVTADLVQGIPFKEIISKYPSLRLNKPMLSVHKTRHFVAEPPDASHFEVSDQEFVDQVRALGVLYTNKGLGGDALSLTETRLIQTAMQGVLNRNRIEDSQQQMQAFMEMLENASKAKWKSVGNPGAE